MTTTTRKTPAKSTPSKPAAEAKPKAPKEAQGADVAALTTPVTPVTPAREAEPSAEDTAKIKLALVGDVGEELSDASEDAGNTQLKKAELVDKIVARTGVKKRDAKKSAEAMLDILAETISGGREINIKPLGKVMLTRTKELDNGEMLMVRIRRVNIDIES